MLRFVSLVSVVLKNVHSTLGVLCENLGALCGKTLLYEGKIRVHPQNPRHPRCHYIRDRQIQPSTTLIF